jgi:hypothetical protein
MSEEGGSTGMFARLSASTQSRDPPGEQNVDNLLLYTKVRALIRALQTTISRKYFAWLISGLNCEPRETQATETYVVRVNRSRYKQLLIKYRD